MKTQALRQALDRHGFDAAFGGARRDEEKVARQGAHLLLPQRRSTPGTRRTSAGAVAIYNTRVAPGESIRVFPLSNWTELDIWHLHLRREHPDRAALFRQAKRPVVERDGMLIMVDDERCRCSRRDAREMRMVRFRTLGCYPLTGAIVPTPTTLPRSSGDAGARTSERRAADRSSDEGRLDGEEEAGGVFLMTTPAADDRFGRHRYLALAAQQSKTLLRFLTCGSVDDGKSTLIGRLLYDTKLIFDDQLPRSSARKPQPHGTDGDDIDFALLVDGLRPSASRASPSTSPTASSRPTSASSSSPTRPATSSTRATWRPAPRPPTSPSSWSTRARAC
jgi:3'-phosphoadenosine 5'-phosphosulfate sulfotransferase (PAPS reductase)/FAD synthetase